MRPQSNQRKYIKIMTASQIKSASTTPSMTPVAQEQVYIDVLYGLLDVARDRAERSLSRTHGEGRSGGTFQARVERDITAAEQARWRCGAGRGGGGGRRRGGWVGGAGGGRRAGGRGPPVPPPPRRQQSRGSRG